MKKTIQQKLYPLTASQDTMCLMLKYSLHKQVTNIPTSLALNRKIDFELMKQAFITEVERNDCLRIRFVKQEKKIYQYFLPTAEIAEIPVLSFRSAEERETYFNKDAAKPIRPLKDEIFRIAFFHDENGKDGVYFNVCHLAMDAVAVSIFFADLFAVYRALESKTDLPEKMGSFEEHLVKEENYIKSKRYERDKAFYHEFHATGGEPFFAGINGPVLLEKQRKKNPDLRVPAAFDPIHDKADMLHLYLSPENTKIILDFCRERGYAPEILMEVGYKIYAASINYRTDDTMIMVLCSRRSTKEEQHMGGCLTQPLQRRTLTKEDMTFLDLLDNATAVRNSLFKHCDFPYRETLDIEREMYNYSQAQGPSFMMYTWLPIEKMTETFGEDVEIDFKGYNLGRYILPLYTFSFLSCDKKSLEYYYMFRTNSLNEKHIRSLHENAVNAILSGIDNNDITLKELFDNVKPNV